MAYIQNHDGDDDGVEHADNRNGELDNIIQTKIGNHEAEQADINAEALVEHPAAAELVEIAANRGGEADGGGDAGKENNQGQHYLSREAHVMHANHVQQLTAVGHDTKGSSAYSACIGQSTVNQG